MRLQTRPPTSKTPVYLGFALLLLSLLTLFPPGAGYALAFVGEGAAAGEDAALAGVTLEAALRVRYVTLCPACHRSMG
ncbi:hypothetical protein OH809_11810 [Streptomyces sp. NBC_00873]|uniref:hypothetical protein n=1 Tax=unclassified Streptomyces TaxID=2593676 RepID=UPI003869A52C|nr:hypothetical protein OH809_11810 [Streptomyces sp. NBC_00873]WTA46677.1 hypothetical protein OH821_31995 [Streptomyces sp. NBC_00842]